MSVVIAGRGVGVGEEVGTGVGVAVGKLTTAGVGDGWRLEAGATDRGALSHKYFCHQHAPANVRKQTAPAIVQTVTDMLVLDIPLATTAKTPPSAPDVNSIALM